MFSVRKTNCLSEKDKALDSNQITTVCACGPVKQMLC